MGSKGDEDKKEIYNELREIIKHLDNIFDLLLPPKEVRNKVISEIREAEISFLKALRTLIDYKIEKLSESDRRDSRSKAQKIKVE